MKPRRLRFGAGMVMPRDVWKLSGQFPQTALEFSPFFLVQWLMSKRLQQRFGRRDKDEHIRPNRHVGGDLPVCCTC